MAGARYEVHFHSQDDVSVFFESTVTGEQLDRLYLHCFAIYAARTAANLGKGDAIGQSLGAVLAQLNDPDVWDQWIETHLDEVNLAPWPGSPGRKHIDCQLNARGFSDWRQLSFKLKAKGFGFMGQGLGYYAPTSVLALLQYIRERPHQVSDFDAKLARTASIIGHSIAMGLVTLSSQQDAGFAAAEAGWELVRLPQSRTEDDDFDPAVFFRQYKSLDKSDMFAALGMPSLPFSEDLIESMFRDACGRFDSCWARDIDKALATEVNQALWQMRFQVLGESPYEDEAAIVTALAAAGYVWRVAEREDDSGSHLNDDKLEEAARELKRGGYSSDGLVLAAISLYNQAALHSNSPGGAMNGQGFLRGAFDYVRACYFAPPESLDVKDMHAAFELGVAVRDLERIAGHSAPDFTDAPMYEAGDDDRAVTSAIPVSHDEGTIQEQTTDEFKRCPDCAEDIRAAARKCRYCGYAYPERTGREQ